MFERACRFESDRGHNMNEVRATIVLLTALRERRAKGVPCYLTTDPAWLLDMAINRRAGWFEDPVTFGTTQPVNGKYPRKAGVLGALYRLASEINTPSLRVYAQAIGDWRLYLLRHLPDRFVVRPGLQLPRGSRLERMCRNGILKTKSNWSPPQVL